MSQPALSQTVNNLERALGVRLLVHGSTGVTATEAGTTLLDALAGLTWMGFPRSGSPAW